MARKRLSRFVNGSLILLASAVAPVLADATDTTVWTSDAGGSYGEPSNWDNGVPGPTINAILDLGNASSYGVDFAGDGTAWDIEVRTGAVAFNLGGHSLTLGDELFVGMDPSNQASLRVVGGELSTVFADVAHQAETIASVTLSGSGTVWNDSTDISVGRQGTGTLTLQSGAAMSMGRDLYVGNEGGNGTLLETGSSTLFSATGRLLVGVSGGTAGQSNGLATITDGASMSMDRQLAVGSGGIGRLIVSGGAQLVSKKSTSASLSSAVLGVDTGVGQYGDGTVTVTGAGSKWTQDGSVGVGFSAKGTLIVQDGGEVDSVLGHIGRKSGSQGSVTVTGSGSVWKVSQDLYVGGESGTAGGSASLTVNSGGAVVVGGPTTPVANTVLVATGGMLAGYGTITGAVANVGGTISPGNSPGSLQADSFELSTGTLVMEIGGTSSGQFDVLDATGAISLGGDLNLSFINGFAPKTGDTFTLFESASLSGSFAETLVNGLMPGWEFEWVPGTGGNLNLVSLNDGTPIPEPGGMVLAVLGMGGLRLRRRSRT